MQAVSRWPRAGMKIQEGLIGFDFGRSDQEKRVEEATSAL